MRILPLEWWVGFIAWLGSGATGVLPFTLRQRLGPVWQLLPLARQVAGALGPWMVARLEVRQRRAWSRPAAEAGQMERGLVQADVQVRPFAMSLLRPDLPWLQGRLLDEFARLSRVIEAPLYLLEQPGWLAWEVRCWALVIILARIGQLYAALKHCQGSATARRVLESAARACEWTTDNNAEV
jgi:hypothetical protein